MGNIGLPELVVVLLIALLIFGASRLPEIGRAMGKSISEFKKGMKEGLKEEEDKQDKGNQGQNNTPKPKT
jgi:TatA/E family protein of Tat protein translocase